MTRSADTSARRARQLRERRAKKRGNAWQPLLLAVALLLGCLALAALAATLGMVGGASGGSSGSGQPLYLLILGVDQRADEAGPTRSDAILLAGSPVEGPAALLSIPRDLWVVIPGVGEQRINTALFYGYDQGDSKAAPRLAVKTVSEALGTPVHRYLVLDFTGFTGFIDALGGVEIDVPRPIVDDQFPTADYGITTVRFEAGLQTMTGEQALVYARTRHDDDDFGRSQRQQQIIAAVAASVLKPSNWPRLPAAYGALQAGALTDLRAADLPALWRMATAVAEGQLARATLADATQPWVTDAGAWVLLPDWPAVRAIVDSLFPVQ